MSKAHLDVYLHPEGSHRRFNNHKTGWRALRLWLADAHLDGVVYEATGRYHKGIERYLGGHGFPIARLDARRARRFAEALGINAKTDPVDARMLAQFGAYLKRRRWKRFAPAMLTPIHFHFDFKSIIERFIDRSFQFEQALLIGTLLNFRPKCRQLSA